MMTDPGSIRPLASRISSRHLGPLCVAALVAVAAVSQSAHADYDAGERAFDSGSFERALAEWRAAARAGDLKSLTRLGKLYEDGVGAPQNYVRAYMFYALAAARGDQDAFKARNELAARMTPDQIATAQNRAATWGETPSGQGDASPKTARKGRSETTPSRDPVSVGALTGDPCNDVAVLAEQLARNFPDIVNEAATRSSSAEKKPKTDYYLSRATDCKIFRKQGQPGDDPLLRGWAGYECKWRYPTPEEAFSTFQPLVDSLKSCSRLSLSFVDETSNVRDRGRGVINHKKHTYESRVYGVRIEVSAFGSKMKASSGRIDDYSTLTLDMREAK